MRSPRSRRFGFYLVALLCLGLSISAGGAVALPGNGLIAFVRDGDVWVVEPDGSNAVNLTEGRVGFAGSVTWSPDGDWLAVQGASGSGTLRRPYVLRADGSELSEVRIGAGNVFLGCWLGPDRLVVSDQRPRPGTVEDSDLFVVRPDGSEVARLTSDGGPKIVETSSCAVSTSTIFYLGIEAGQFASYRVGTDGAEPARLGLIGVGAPIPSPDGSRVVVADGGGVVVAAADGSGATRISTQTPASKLAWAPDGGQLAFVHAVVQGPCDRYGCQYGFDVRTLAHDGSSEQQLTSTRPPNPGKASWSPDGQRIVFTTGSSLQVMNLDGTCETSLLSQTLDQPEAVAWQPVDGMPPAQPIRCADIGVRGEAPLAAVTAGGTSSLRFTVANDGTEPATASTLTASVAGPAVPLSIEATQGSCTLTTLTCALGAVDAHAEAVVTVAVRSTIAPATSLSELPFRGGSIVVTAVVDAAEDDRHPDNSAGAATWAAPCTGVTSPGVDLVRGTEGVDVLCGVGRLLGLGGADILSGGAGDDVLEGGAGGDEISAAGYDDRIHAGRGNDFVDAGSGHDRVTGGPGSDDLLGGGDRDRIDGGAGDDDLDGGGSSDRLTGGSGRDEITAGYGYDVVLARDGARDRVTCGERFDIVYADRKDRVGRDCELVRRKLAPDRRRHKRVALRSASR